MELIIHMLLRRHLCCQCWVGVEQKIGMKKIQYSTACNLGHTYQTLSKNLTYKVILSFYVILSFTVLAYFCDTSKDVLYLKYFFRTEEGKNYSALLTAMVFHGYVCLSVRQKVRVISVCFSECSGMIFIEVVVITSQRVAVIRLPAVLYVRMLSARECLKIRKIPHFLSLWYDRHHTSLFSLKRWYTAEVNILKSVEERW